MSTTVLDRHELAATRNLLKFTRSLQQQLKVAVTPAAFNFGTANFMLSFVVVGTQGYLFKCIKTAGVYWIIYYDAGYMHVQFATAENTNVSMTSTGLPNQIAPASRLFRFTIIRRGTVIEYWNNNRMFTTKTLPSTDNINMSGVEMLLGSDGAADTLNGSMGNFVLLQGAAPSVADMTEFHRSNVIPKALHQYVVAHYKTNNSFEGILFDNVEDYNYAKSSPVTATHPVLVNYSNAELGITNPLLQSTMKDFYNFQTGDLKTFRCIDNNVYGSVSPALGTLSSWTIVINLIQEHGYVAALKNVFCNKNTFDADFIGLFYQDVTPIEVSGKIGNYDLYIGADVGVSYNFGAYNKQPLVFVMTYTGGVFKFYVNSGDGVVYTATRNVTYSFNGALLQFFRYTANPNYGQGICLNRFQLINRVITDYERNLILSRRTFPYEDKLLLSCQINVNFGEIFLSGVDYKARDNSGNNRDVLLNNFNPATNQPLLVEQTTGMLPRKALRLVKASSHYIQVANFNPTKELGYTYLIGFALDSNRNFATAGEYLLGKREASNNKAKLLFGGNSKVTGFLNYDPPNNITGVGNNSFANYDTSKLIFYWSSELGTKHKSGAFGFLQQDASTYIVGWDEVDSGAIFLGADDQGTFAGSGLLDGYLALVGIWKGVLNPKEIADVINLNQPPTNLQANCQLYLNFDEIINDAGTYRVKDYSPQNRTSSVSLVNYTANEVNPAHADYKLFPVKRNIIG